MDLNILITQTINTLSKPQLSGGYHEGEIPLAEAAVKKQEGGREASREEIDRALGLLNQAGRRVDSRVSFEYNKKTKRLVMKVTDPRTHEVVRQLPSRDILRILENIHDMIGVFIDEQR